MSTLLRSKAFIAIFVFAICILTGCSNSNVDVSNKKEQQSQKLPSLTKSEKSDLKKLTKIINIEFDAFNEEYILNSRPRVLCPNHSLWIEVRAGIDVTKIRSFVWLYTQDDINSNIGNPSGVLIKQTGIEPILFSSPTDENLNNLSCGGSIWGYPSKHILVASWEQLDYLEEVFSDPTSRFRLQPQEIKSGYRDIEMGQDLRKRNLAMIKILRALINEQISRAELFGDFK